MPNNTVEQFTSTGPMRINWGINRWVLVETGGQELQRQVRSHKELEGLLVRLGIPPDEAADLATREWATRPSTAGLSAADTGLGLSRVTGVSSWVIFPLALLLGVAGLYVTFRYYVAPALDKALHGPRISKARDRPVAIRFVHAYYDVPDERAAFREVTRLSDGSVERADFLRDRKQRLHIDSPPGGCGGYASDPCFSFKVKGDPVPNPAYPRAASIAFGTVYVSFRPRGGRPTVWGEPGFSGGVRGCELGANCKTVPERFHPHASVAGSRD